MGDENDGAFGRTFLDHVECAIRSGLAAGAFKQQHLLEFARHFRQAELAVSDDLKIDLDATPPSALASVDLNGQLMQMPRDAREKGAGPYVLFAMPEEMLAALSNEMLVAIAGQISRIDDPWFERVRFRVRLTIRRESGIPPRRSRTN